MHQFVERHWARINLFFYLAIFASVLGQGYRLISAAHPDIWSTADWLINYQGGFVRRGLAGEILFQISSHTHIDLVLLATALPILLYAITYFFSYQLTKDLKANALTTALVFSPAFTLFAFHSHYGSFRKEVLLFALLSVHTFCQLKMANGLSRKYLSFIGLAFIALVLSHEALIIFFPYFLCGVYLNHKERRFEILWKYAVVMIPSAVLAMLLMTLFKGNADTVAGICASLLNHTPLDCALGASVLNAGALGSLKSSFAVVHQITAQLNPPIMTLTYCVLFLLALAPIAYLYKRAGAFTSDKFLLIFPASAMILTLPLLPVFSDYGRLICMHATCMTFVGLQILNMRRDEVVEARKSSALAWSISLIFILGWRLTHYGALPSNAIVPIKLYDMVTHSVSAEQ